jgi:Zinc binding domain
MNKAFTREPDETGAKRCPQCDSPGQQVGPETLAAQVGDEARTAIAESAYFCPYARCEVAYFDAFERVVKVDRLKHPIYPKDPTAPLCPCFGLTTEDVEQDVREGVVTRVRELVARTKSPEARCKEMSPTGQSCIAEVQRYYLRFRETWTERPR